MSKLDAVRALREARYAKTMAQARGGPGAMPTARPRVAPTTPAARPTLRAVPDVTEGAEAVTVAEEAGEAEATEELCGHRNMSGRTCTRERGHSAKSHRYS
jgi:hypothetical protein